MQAISSERQSNSDGGQSSTEGSDRSGAIHDKIIKSTLD